MTPQPTACLVFKGASDVIACGAAGVSIELVGEGLNGCESDLVREVASGVLHYFRHDLGRDTVTVGEFAVVLAKVLRGFGLNVESCLRVPDATPAAEADLTDLIERAGAHSSWNSTSGSGRNSRVSWNRAPAWSVLRVFAFA